MKIRALRFLLLSFFLSGLVFTGILSCGGSGGGGGGGGGGGVATVEISNCAGPLALGGTLPLTAVAKDSKGSVIGSATISFSSGSPRIVSVNATGLATALYPGTASLTATSGSVSSAACSLTVNPLANSKQVVQLTTNATNDNWGLNNNWPIVARGQLMWFAEGAANSQAILHKVSDPVGTNTPIVTVPGGAGSLDHLALGSGATAGSLLLSYRVFMGTETFAWDGVAPPVNIGAQETEENSIADGCLFYRESQPVQDIFRFQLPNQNTNITNAGVAVTNPITSGCKAVWLKPGVVNADLIYFDGTTQKTIATGLSLTNPFDFRNGRIVFPNLSDIFLYDTTAANPQAVNITNSPADLENFAKTDGDSVLISRVAGGITNQIVLYDIASGTSTAISNNTNIKNGESLQIDKKQAVWIESAGTVLTFHNGSGAVSGTSQVPLPGGVTLSMTNKGYIGDGIVAFVGNDGDDEVFMMK